MSNEIAVQTSTSINPFAPRNWEEAYKLAKIMSESDLVPKDYRGKPGNCFLAMQMGHELGVGEMQAIQNIAVINGRPSLWGDIGLAIVKSHRDFAGIIETTVGEGDKREAVCILKRKGEPDVESRFSVTDAKTADLWGKPGPWKQYPNRMLKMRARWFAMRDQFPDALKGIHGAEEMIIIDANPPSSTQEPYQDPKEKTVGQGDSTESKGKKTKKEETSPSSKDSSQSNPAPVTHDRITEEEVAAVKARWNMIADKLKPATRVEKANELKQRFGFADFKDIHPDQLIEVMIALDEIQED